MSFGTAFVTVILACCLSTVCGSSIASMCPSILEPMCSMTNSCAQLIICVGALYIIWQSFGNGKTLE